MTAYNQLSHRRVLIIGADGLRPDLVDHNLMPNVTTLARTGTTFTDHHAVYPSHTRVNMSSLATGAHPGMHGIIANTMLVSDATDDHVIDTSDYQHLDAFGEANGGAILGVPSFADALASSGSRVAVAGTGSPGSNLLWTTRHRSRLINTNSAYGIPDLYDLREKLGPVPDKATPDLDRLDYVMRAVTDVFLPDPANRVIVAWLAEPDSSLHRFGLGSPEVSVAMRAVDQVVEGLLDELRITGTQDQFDIFFMSDHGHSTVRAHNTLREYLEVARADLGNDLPPLATASDYIYAQPGSDTLPPERLQSLIDWLNAQPWCNVVLSGYGKTSTPHGTIPMTDLWDSAQASHMPLLAVSPVWSESTNEFGISGDVAALTTQAALKSSHGSLSPFDMHATFIANGPSFHSGLVSELPSGAIDLAPTIQAILGIPSNTDGHGRVLHEGLVEASRAPQRQADEIIAPRESVKTDVAARVRIHKVDSSRYVHGSELPVQVT